MKIIGLQLLSGYASARGTMRVLALAGTGILLMANGGLVSPAFADLEKNYCYENDRVIADTTPPGILPGPGFISETYGGHKTPTLLNCTSGDVFIASPTFVLLDGCINAEDTATFIFGGELTSNANAVRHDIGFWFNVSGGNSQEDPEPIFADGLGTECNVEYLRDSAPPGISDGDACGDIGAKASVTGTFSPPITISCKTKGDAYCPASPDAPTLQLHTTIMWKTTGADNTVCTGLKEALLPGNDAKCRSECKETGLEVPELTMVKSCTEDPSNHGDTDDWILFPGDKLNCVIQVQNGPAPAGIANNLYVYDNYPPFFSLIDNFKIDTIPVTPAPNSVLESPTTSAYEGEFNKVDSFLWKLGDVLPNSISFLSFDMTVDSNAADTTDPIACNTATLAYDNPGPAPGGATGPDGMINLWEDDPAGGAGTNDPDGNGVIGELQDVPLIEATPSVCQITLASIEDFRVSNAGGVNAIRWRTSSELGTLGFHVEWLDPATGEYVRLNSELLPANITAPQGSKYEFVDDRATAGQGNYRLIEVESIGRTLVHGPYETGKQDAQNDTNPPAASMGLEEEADITAEGGKYKARGHQRSEKMQQRLEKMKQEHQQNGKQKPGRSDNKGRKNSPLVQPAESFSVTGMLRQGIESVLDFLIPSANAADAMKVETDAIRMTVITPQQIADIFGVTSASIEQRISTGDIRITSHGTEIGWHQDNGAVVFFTGGLSAEESLYANNNVYWVTLEAGTVAGQVNGLARNSRSISFRETIDVENDVFAAIHYPQLDDDFWYWGYLTSTAGTDDLSLPSPLTFEAPGATGTGDAVVTVRLKGAGIEADNRVNVVVNGTQVQTTQWQGKDENIVTATFDSSLLQDENTLSLTPANGAVFTYVLFDGLSLEYDRLYAMENGYLRFNTESNAAVTLSGFTSSAISVFDVSNPAATVQLTGLTPKYSKKSKSWTVKIKTDPGAEYIAYTDAAEVPVSMSSYDSLGVVASVQGADYVVIASEETLVGAQAMAAYRQTKGHQTAVVTIEQIVDELNDGIQTPWVVRDFLQQAWTTSGGKTKYALIAGAGNFDYRDLLPDTAGTNHVPPPLIENRYGVFGADMLSGDVDGNDGLPEIAVGRIPAFTNAELLAYRDKLQVSEANHDGWAKRALWIADDAEAFGRFDDESDLAITKVPRYVESVKAYLNKPYSKSEVKSLITSEIKKGVSVVHYLGHGSESRLAAETIYEIDDVVDLDNIELPVFIGLTCAIARFDHPGVDSLGMALVMKESGGASTVLGPTSLSSNHWASGVGREFLHAIFSQGEKTVGAAVLAALRAQGADSDLISTHKFLEILGDPAATIR